MKKTTEIAAIIIAYKTPAAVIDRLCKQLRQLFNATCIVVDNTKDNIGFAGAANKGIAQAIAHGAEICIVCNPDISIQTGDREALLTAATHFDIFSGVMKQEDTTYYGGTIDYWTMAGGLTTEKPRQPFSACDFVSGSFMCITRKAIDTIGLFSLRYFLYYEDTDYCLRATRSGLRVGVTAEIIFNHTEQSRHFAQKDYYLARNRLKFLFTHGSLLHKAREVVRLPLLFIRLIMSRNPADSLQLRGYTDFIYGKEISH